MRRIALQHINKCRKIKVFLLTFMVMQITSLLLIACVSDTEEDKYEEVHGVIIPEANYSNEMSDFLVTYVKNSIDYWHSDLGSKCFIINNMSELSDFVVSLSEDKIPNIDFSKYSLLIGSASYSHYKRGDKIPTTKLKQMLYKTEKGYTVELHYNYSVINNDDNLTYDEKWVTFWGLYPKLDNIKIFTQFKFINNHE